MSDVNEIVERIFDSLDEILYNELVAESDEVRDAVLGKVARVIASNVLVVEI